MLSRITDNIYKLVVRFPFGIREVNSYLVKGEKGYTVIDTGSYAKESIEIWKSVIKEIKIEKVVLTHAHPDHIGCAKWLQEQVNAPVYISSKGYDEMKLHQNIHHIQFLSNLIVQHGGESLPEEALNMELSAYKLEPDYLFEESESIILGDEQYETVWTPGHSPDHICFYQRKSQVMIVGDHLLKGVTPFIMTSSNDSNPLLNYLESLQKIQAYETTLMLPGHGDLIRDVEREIIQTETRIKYRLKQVSQVVEKEPINARRVSEIMYGKNGGFTELLATITRLIYLTSIGELNQLRDGQNIYYEKRK